MALILLLICFFALFLSMCIYKPTESKRVILLYCIILFSLGVVAVTEALSFFHLLTYLGLVLCWGLCAMGLVYYLYIKRVGVPSCFSALKKRINQIYGRLNRYELTLLYSAALLLLLLFVQGVVNPPNNYDSLTYHLPRIVSWISHRSVYPFPTHILRQVYQPPFAEYLILNVNLLSRGDYFSASVQFFYLVFCLVTITLITKRLLPGGKFQFTSFLLGLTIPEVVLQASSTQNDIVLAFFGLSCFYFLLKSIEGGLKNYLFLGLSAGLCILTKGTGYLFVAPILLLFGIIVLIKTFKTKKLKYLIVGFVCAAIIPLLLNSPVYCRNYSFSGNFLGIDKAESKLYANQRMNPKLFVCNFVKDADLHGGIMCIPRVTALTGKITHKIFDLAGVNIDDPDINFPGFEDLVKGVPGDKDYYNGLLVATHDDFGGNLIHLILIWIAIILAVYYLIRHKKEQPIILLLITITLQVIIFCAYLKWQPWGTRLQTCIFLSSVPVICYACGIYGFFGKLLTRFFVPLLIIYALILSLFNYSRPYITEYRKFHGFYITSPMAITFNRFVKQFATNFKGYTEYRDITNDIKKSDYKNIGLIIGYNDREYPLFTECYTRELNPVHIFVTNCTKNITGYNDAVDCIVSTITNQPFIDYKGKRFYNQDSGNTTIYYYK